MKAVFFEKAGSRDVLQYKDFPTPKPKLGEALIHVKACALNNLDVQLRNGKLSRLMPKILGSDVSGIIEEINGKSEFSIGNEVVINPAIPCGNCMHCLEGKPCDYVKILGYDTQGGYAEYIIAPISQLYAKPKNLSFEEAAAFPLTFLTAWHMLVTRVNLQKNETIFIWGASGGLGTAAIQIAKHLGATIIAAARMKPVLNKLKNWGQMELFCIPKERWLKKSRHLQMEKELMWCLKVWVPKPGKPHC